MFSFIPLPYKILIILFLLAGAVSVGYVKGSEKSKQVIAEYQAKANAKIAGLEKKNNEIDFFILDKFFIPKLFKNSHILKK